ncbi:MAG TPA: hypothetical protein VFJ58_21820 [Armatimonadota bacterium]|nr:hypothetical protein [Armatimonadota bacterium]
MDARIDHVVKEVSRGRVFALLPDETQQQIQALSQDDLQEGARRVMTRPMPGDVSQAGRLLLNPCLAVQWISMFEELRLPAPLKLFEACAGGSDPVILAAEIYTAGRAEYTTINLNRKLAGELRGRLGKLRLRARIIEDHVEQAHNHIPRGSMDVACFHHAINDILQTAVSEPRGLDTRDIDWWTEERQMIEWLGDDYASGRLDDYARPALLNAVRRAIEMVRPGGYILFDHWTWDAHRQMSWFPWELFCSLIPLAREWIQEAGLPLVERPLKGRNPRWWACFRVLGS